MTKGSEMTTFQLDPRVFNFAKSYLFYQVTPLAGTDYNLYFSDGVCEIQRIQLVTKLNEIICDISEMSAHTLDKCDIMNEKGESIDFIDAYAAL